MSKRIQVVLPDYLYSALEIKATKEGRSISNLAAFLLELSLHDELKEQKSLNQKHQ